MIFSHILLHILKYIRPLWNTFNLGLLCFYSDLVMTRDTAVQDTTTDDLHLRITEEAGVMIVPGHAVILRVSINSEPCR